jgi:hypothetical protein
VLGPVVIGGLVVAVPWLLRDLAVFGTPFPGQAVENLWLRRNLDIFAWADRPSASDYLGRGIGALLGDRIHAFIHQVVSVLLVPPFPVGLVGVLSVLALGRSPAVRRPTGLALLLLSGSLTFLATALLFPVATRWGTFLHAAGPLLVGLVVAAALGGDALMARVSARRRWPRENVIVAPIALLAVVVPLLALQLLVIARSAQRLEARLSAVATDVRRAVLAAVADGQDGPGTPAGRTARPVLITDHPMWLAAATGLPAIALPDESASDVADLARAFGAAWIVLLDPDDRRAPPDASDPAWAACLGDVPVTVGPPDEPAWLLRLRATCGSPS